MRSYISYTSFSVNAEWLVMSSNFGEKAIILAEVILLYHATFFPLPEKNKRKMVIYNKRMEEG